MIRIQQNKDKTKKLIMFDFLKRILKNSRGAMDSILVSLLLVIIGVGVVASLSDWLSDKTTEIQQEANRSLEKIISE